MIYASVYDKHENLIASKRFKSFERMTDYASGVVGSMIEAATIKVDNNGEHAVIDCWQLRDKAIANGYELPVHRQMLAHL